MSSGDFDSHLVDRLNKCDESAFELIFHTYYSALCNYAIGFLQVENEVEDIVQNVFINLIRNIRNGLRFNNEVEVKNYIYRSVRNRCLNFIRDINRQKNNMGGSELLSDEASPDLELDIIRNEILSIIFDAINKLPQACREIFIHSYVDEWTDKQIAETYDISLNTVKTQKARAKKKLRDLLGDILFDP